jgi:hypothetical protein
LFQQAIVEEELKKKLIEFRLMDLPSGCWRTNFIFQLSRQQQESFSFLKWQSFLLPTTFMLKSQRLLGEKNRLNS